MPKTHTYIFVLWGEQFEEAIASLFVTRLREAGLRVKVVGLTPPHIRGAHGLALVPDLTLDQALALAEQVVCLIIPHPGQGLGWFKNDPRIALLFERTATNQAKVIIGAASGLPPADLGWQPPTEANLSFYSKGEDLATFISEVTCSLLKTT